MAWFGVLNAVLFGVIILVKWKRRPTKYFLAGFLFSTAIVAAGSLAISSKLILAYPALIYLHSPFSFLAAPLLFLTVLSSRADKTKPHKWFWLHFSPFLIALALHLPFYLQSAAKKLLYLDQAYSQLPINRELFFWSVMAQLCVYLFAIWATLARAHRTIQSLYLKWSIVFAFFLTLLAATALVRKLSLYSYDQSDIMAFLPGAWMIYTIYHFLRPDLDKQQAKSDKYSKSGLSQEDSKVYIEQLLGYLDNQKPYLDSEFSLIEASAKLGLKPNYLSQSINQNLNRTFTEVMNEYRIRQAAEMITNPSFDHLTIEGIANEVGFRSKSAFYNNFKKQLGKSPKEYKLSGK